MDPTPYLNASLLISPCILNLCLIMLLLMCHSSYIPIHLKSDTYICVTLEVSQLTCQIWHYTLEMTLLRCTSWQVMLDMAPLSILTCHSWLAGLDLLLSTCYYLPVTIHSSISTCHSLRSLWICYNWYINLTLPLLTMSLLSCHS